jgi:hypothetical protein
MRLPRNLTGGLAEGHVGKVQDSSPCPVEANLDRLQVAEVHSLEPVERKADLVQDDVSPEPPAGKGKVESLVTDLRREHLVRVARIIDQRNSQVLVVEPPIGRVTGIDDRPELECLQTGDVPPGPRRAPDGAPPCGSTIPSTLRGVREGGRP